MAVTGGHAGGPSAPCTLARDRLSLQALPGWHSTGSRPRLALWPAPASRSRPSPSR